MPDGSRNLQINDQINTYINKYQTHEHDKGKEANTQHNKPPPPFTAINQFNILQINARSINANKILIETLIHKKNIDICIISETWLKENTQFKLKNYNIHAKNRDDGYGGVAIITKNKFNVKTKHITSTQ